MRCTECERGGEDVIERVFVVNEGAEGGAAGASLGPLRLCEGCWERRKEGFRRQLDEEWRANVRTVRGSRSGRGTRPDGDRGTRR